MSDSTLTRCPHCQTRFRVTEQQLGVASGKVRCGNCMEVFNAREHAVGGAASNQTAPTHKPAPVAPAPQNPPAVPARPAATAPAEAEDEELLFQDNPDEDAIDGHYTRSFKSSDDLSDSFLALDQGSQFHNDSDEVENISEIDESWAEEMLHDTERQESRAGQESSAASVGPKTAATPARPLSSPPAPATESEPTPAEPALLPVPAAESGSESGAGSEPAAEGPFSAQPARSPLKELSLSVEADDIRYADSDSRNRTPKRQAPAAQQSAPANPYADLRSNPIATKRSGGNGLWWLLGSLFLLGLLASQLFYFQIDRLSQYEPLRPLYTVACPLLGCELPEMIDTDQIESRKLVVRSHPDEPKALLVEALIVNQAPFAQPFPSIILTFSNLNNDVVAQRAFKPDEYLADEALDLPAMATDTPVKIALELRDPGQDAVNYSLRFLPAPQAKPQ